MLKGFKEFVSKGNAIDLAVGVIIGAAFGNVVSALTDQFLNPLIGALFGQPNFDDVLSFKIELFGDPAVVRPGAILTALVSFLITAAALYFALIVPMNAMNKKKDEVLGLDEVEEEEPVSAEVALLTEIRDSLAAKNENS